MIGKLLFSEKLIFLILLVGLFFRIYKLDIFYSWGHDQDLFAWIAKDIVIDGHFRLIGQETSITGVFIGPLFYYLIAISFAIFRMDPLSAYIPITIISLLTIFSIYWVFGKFFGNKTALVGAFLYAFSPGIILLDRWIVPTQPTNLWVIWYLYVLLTILKGNIPLIFLGALIGLIWHVHVAFIPLLAFIPLAVWLSIKGGKKIKFKFSNLVIPFLVFVILMFPFFAFEIRHGFQQIKGLVSATYDEKDDIKGLIRLKKVFNTSGRSLAGIFLLDKNSSLPEEFFISIPILFLLTIVYLYKTNSLTKNQTTVFIVWIGINLLSQFISKRPIPEYYFANHFMIFFLILSLLFSSITNSKKTLLLIPLILGLYLSIAALWFLSRPDDRWGYLQKRKTIEYIRNSAQFFGYPCIAVNFIEASKGLPNGYRYLLWINNLKVITSGDDVPVYSIVTPWNISAPEISAKFGVFGVIIPKEKKVDPKICSKADRQLLPLWGFTN